MASQTPIKENVDLDLRNLDDDIVDLISYVKHNLPKQTTIDLIGGIYCHICESVYNRKEFENHYERDHGQGEKLLYSCVVCHKQHKNYRSLRGHCYYMHLSRGRHRCEHCSKNFSKFAALRDHINNMHNFKCSTCNKLYTTKTDLQLHNIIHADQSNNYCQACEIELPTIASCKDHIDLHTVYIYSCPICNENISSKDDAGAHLAKHFDDAEVESSVQLIKKSDNHETHLEKLGGIACCYCTVSFENKVVFDAHFSSNHSDKELVYCCVVCKKSFEKYSVFWEHTYNHSTKDKFCCTLCYKTFNRLSMLVTHMAACQMSMHVCEKDEDAKGKPFACPECGHRYVTEQRLRGHLLDAHGIHCLRCLVPDCSKTFSTPKELVLHQYVHTSYQNWCRQCGLMFTSLAACERHLDVHRRTIYSCPVCNRDYREKHVLVKHIMQHFENTVHICKLCGKVFNHKRRFTDHLLTHNTKEAYTCTYCGKGFTNLHRLQQHLNTHTGSKPYKCTICNKTFASYPNCVKHKNRMHKLNNKVHQNPTSDKIDNLKNVNIEYTNKNKKGNICKLKELHQPKYNESLMENDNSTVVDNLNLRSPVYNENLNEINNEIEFTESNSNITIGDTNSNTIYDDNMIEMSHIMPQIESDMNVRYEFQVQNSTMEAEPIHNIDIEKELLIMANNPVKQINGNFEFVDSNILDNVCVEVSPNMGPSEAVYSAEYGPEFTIGDSCGILDLDDHMLPHIDPLLTIKTEGHMTSNILLPQNMEAAMYQETQKWEPPVFTKVCPDHPYYGDMVDTNRFSMMNTDIF
ncbi:zinc finger protein 569 [Bicyclus anynana]|uniref:Zinc finger protein 569 n=1 Tax=Bicyclus anynana TaxID=110368 RepID=A0A6J1N7L6_BICAN|nr:zinc finger protein 569 [Bicyclus anynana]XP_052739778.1 zinc finger protein 569 [Bicyclus anynana]